MRIVDIVTINVNNMFTIKCDFKSFLIFSIGLRSAGKPLKDECYVCLTQPVSPGGRMWRLRNAVHA